MSFYFHKAKQKAIKLGPDKLARKGPSPQQRQNVEVLHRLGCAACPLNKADVQTPKMTPTLAAQTQVYFLAEAPGRDEDEVSGEPLTGPSGQLLRSCIPRGMERYCSFDNLVNCRPEDNRTPVWAEIECCRPRRWKYVNEAKPKLIVGMGLPVLQAILNSSDMQGMRGRVFAVNIGGHHCWFLPTYHPSFILRKAFNKNKPLQSMMGHCFRMDIQRAFDILEGLPEAHVDTEEEARAGVDCFNGNNFDDLITLLRQAKEAKYKTVDLETKGLRPFAEGAAIMTAAISFKSTNFAFAIDHPDSRWSQRQREDILTEFGELLADDTIKIAHNVPFELEWLIDLYGKEIVNHTAWHCTQMQAHFLDERRGKQVRGDDDKRAAYQDLNFLVKQHFGIPFKGLFKLNKKDMSKADLDETLLYNGVDTKYELRLFHRQTALLKQNGLYDAYLDALPRQPAVALMQSIGIDVDQAEVKVNQKKLGSEIEGLEAQIEQLKVVQAYKKDKGEFNPHSDQSVLEIFQKYLNRPEVAIKEGEGTRYSVNKAVLSQIDHPLSNLIITYRNRCKLKSTYVDQFEMGVGAYIFPDGKIHPHFNTTFAETGRTTCCAEWTPILTRRGLIEIKDVAVGDFVWTHKQRWRRVTTLWRKGFEQMYNVHLNNGQVLTCTKNHRLLMSDGTWTKVGEVCGLFEKMGKQFTKCREHIALVSQQRDTVDNRHRKEVEYTASQYLVYSKDPFRSKRETRFDGFALLSIKDGAKEPYEGEDIKFAPFMERSLSGWEGVLHDKNASRQNIPTPSRSDTSFGDHQDPAWLGSPSHRWGSKKQQSGQLGSCDGGWASGYSPSAACQQDVKIERIETGRSCEVFDITVDEDASYLSCGVFSHNSDEPNGQNWPQRNDSWIRKEIVPPKNHVILAFDYGQLEGCTSAMCSKDKTLVKALWEDYDIHMDFTKKVVAVYPELLDRVEGDIKKCRSVIKNKYVFPAVFGAQGKSIAGYLNMPEDVIDDLMTEFWEMFSGLKKWQDATMKKYYDVGYAESPNGRRRYYPLTRNQVINHPIQCLACEIVCDAMNRLSYKAAQEGKWHLHPIMNIHDDLSFITPDADDIIEDSISTIYSSMLSPPYDCINVPLSVKASVGYNWYEMTEVGTFWSHKDL